MNQKDIYEGYSVVTEKCNCHPYKPWKWELRKEGWEGLLSYGYTFTRRGAEKAVRGAIFDYEWTTKVEPLLGKRRRL